MASPQDGPNANGLTKVTEIPKGKELIFIDPTTNEGGIITLEDLTTQILKNLTSQTFALDQGNMTLLAALNQLNSNSAFGKHIALGSSKNAIKITPSTSYQLFFVYGYLSKAWMGVIASEEKVSGFKFEKVGSEPVSVETSGENSLILKYSNSWGQAVISSKYAFSYELLQL